MSFRTGIGFSPRAVRAPALSYNESMVDQSPRGSSLGGTLLAVAILASLAAGLASLCVTHLRLASRSESALLASNLARSVVAAGISRVLEDQEYGVARLAEETIIIDTDQGQAFLTFSVGAAQDEGFLHSTNNAAESTSAEGAGGRSVPANTIHLVGRGVSGGVERRVEAVLSVPSFPWALAAGGEVMIRDGAVVGSLPDNVWPPAVGDLLPADLVSNSTSSSAVVLGSGSHVMGDVETAGQVVLQGDSVQVDGQIRESVAPSEIPRMTAQDFDPQVLGLEFDDLSGAASLTGGERLVLTGTARFGGDLQLAQGFEMVGAALYVDGDLRVDGAIVGTGILVVNGDIEVNSGVTLDGATKVAIISAGRVTLRGVGPASSAIRGLFYAQEGLLAEEITVVGSMIAGGDTAGVELVNSRVLGQSLEGSEEQTNVVGQASGGSGGRGLEDFRRALAGTAARLPGFEGDFGGPRTETTPANPGSAGSSSSSESSSFLPLKERVRVVTWFED